MIDHIGFPVSDYARAKAFYQQALAPLGYVLVKEVQQDENDASAAGFGVNVQILYGRGLFQPADQRGSPSVRQGQAGPVRYFPYFQPIGPGGDQPLAIRRKVQRRACRLQFPNEVPVCRVANLDSLLARKRKPSSIRRKADGL